MSGVRCGQVCAGAGARGFLRSHAFDDVRWRLGRPQINSALLVKNMLEIVLGVFVVIGVFVFWCDVTDSWNKVLPRKKY
jgi:hypothetical protein